MKLVLSNIKKWKWGRLILLLVGCTLIVSLATIDGFLLPFTSFFQKVAESKNLFFIVAGIATLIGIVHLIFVSQKGLAKEHLFYKRMGPIISSPLTAATQGVFIYSGIEIVYIVCYDVTTIKEFQNLNKLAISITMLVVVVYAIYILSLMIHDIAIHDSSSSNTGRIIASQDEDTESDNIDNKEEK